MMWILQAVSQIWLSQTRWVAFHKSPELQEAWSVCSPTPWSISHSVLCLTFFFFSGYVENLVDLSKTYLSHLWNANLIQLHGVIVKIEAVMLKAARPKAFHPRHSTHVNQHGNPQHQLVDSADSVSGQIMITSLLRA